MATATGQLGHRQAGKFGCKPPYQRNQRGEIVSTTVDLAAYQKFLEDKVSISKDAGCECKLEDIHPLLKPHQKAIVQWAVQGGRRAIFANFGLGKSLIQLEICRIITKHLGPQSKALIVCPLGVRQEFAHDAAMIGLRTCFIQHMDDLQSQVNQKELVDLGTPIYVTNYESVRNGKLDPRGFDVVSLDEAAILRGFGSTLTFRKLMGLFEGTSTFRFVATATPDPNEYIELLAYADWLGVMPTGEAKTRFFKRDSTKADHLTLHANKAEEFWLWVSTWATFLSTPSDLGYSDEGYILPPMTVNWHELPTNNDTAAIDRDGQKKLWKDAAAGLSQAAAEKRDSLADRIAKMKAIIAESPNEHFLIWCDLEKERKAIHKALPECTSVYGTQKWEEREAAVMGFANGTIPYLSSKASMLGQGCNFQKHCHRAIFVGIGYKFALFAQAMHRIYRFLQEQPVTIDIIYTEAESGIRDVLEAKWERHKKQLSKMAEIIREHGLASASKIKALQQGMGIKRVEETGENWRLVNNDTVLETAAMKEDTVSLIITSIPFSFQYQYSANYADFGESETNDAFWAQMDFLTPNLLRVLRPGRVCCIHVKDRIVPGGLTGLGFQTLHPFHAEAIAHYMKHGFAFLGMKTVTTDVVRENNQTYRLGWSEQCKDGSRMGCGVPEYVLLFRKPPSDLSNGYADDPVLKSKPDTEFPDGHIGPYDYDGGKVVPGTGYSRARWQLDAHGYMRSSGNRFLTPEDMDSLPHAQIYRRWKEECLSTVYDFEHHVNLGELMERDKRLPSTFMVMPPHSPHPDVWSDVARMRTLNMLQERTGRVMHLCVAVGSLVLTRQHGYIPIETVVTGDEVLTHMGRWRKVIVSQSTGIRETVELLAQGVPGLKLTPDHKLWTRKVRQIPWARAKRRLDAIKRDPLWVEASETVGHFVNLKLPPVETPHNDSMHHWWIVGRWLADGHKGGHEGRDGQVLSYTISCGYHETEYLVETLGVHAGVPHDVGTGMQITLRDEDFAIRSILAKCGRGAANKHLPPEAFTLPPAHAKILLDGYLSGDGHYLDERKRFTGSSVSKALLLGMAMLAQRVYGAIASIYRGRPEREATIQGRTVHCQQDYAFCFDDPTDRQLSRVTVPFVVEDGAWKTVRSAEPSECVETWNLRVEEDESYTVEGCIVKNCPLQEDIIKRLITQFTMPGEVVYDPFDGIGSVAYWAVKLKRFGMGCELNASYHADAVIYCTQAALNRDVPMLFDALEEEKEIAVSDSGDHGGEE
jgi:hypothetical protein